MFPNPLSFIRQEPGFQVIKDPASSRSVFIMIADSTEAIIEVSQPSDCLLLQTDHVKCGVETLWVLVDCKFINSVNGPLEQQSSHMWKEALIHLLRTFRPTLCFLDIIPQYTGIPDGYRVLLEDGTLYGAYWNEAQSLLRIMK